MFQLNAEIEWSKSLHAKANDRSARSCAKSGRGGGRSNHVTESKRLEVEAETPGSWAGSGPLDGDPRAQERKPARQSLEAGPPDVERTL